MELLRFAALALLCALALAGGDATSSRSAEEYWHSIWPHTSMPKNLEYLLGSGVNGAENKDTQYPHTSFFEDDLHVGKQMNIEFNIPHSYEEQKSNAMEKDTEKSSSRQPFGVNTRKRSTMNDHDLVKSANLLQWGHGSKKGNTDDEDLVKSANLLQWGHSIKKRSTNDEDLVKSANLLQWGHSTKKQSTNDEDLVKSANLLQWGHSTKKRSTNDEDLVKSANLLQWGHDSKKQNTNDKDLVKSANLLQWGHVSKKQNTNNEDLVKSATLHVSKKQNTKDEDLVKSANHLPRGLSSRKRNTRVNEPENLTLKEICDVKDKFVGEEGKYCAESMESLLDFVISKLGKDIEALSSSFVPHQTRYTILEGSERVSSEGVMCHKLEYYKPIFYCHQVNSTITYIVPVEAADGTRTNILALCHRDTRGLDAQKLFHQHKVMPGTVPICHFLGSGSISWVPRNNEIKATY